MLWTENDNRLSTSLAFHDFSQAFAFMMEVAMLAEKHNHHPHWTNVWNRVDIHLNTHDAGGVVTEKDRKLAEGIQIIARRYGI